MTAPMRRLPQEGASSLSELQPRAGSSTTNSPRRRHGFAGEQPPAVLLDDRSDRRPQAGALADRLGVVKEGPNGRPRCSGAMPEPLSGTPAAPDRLQMACDPQRRGFAPAPLAASQAFWIQVEHHLQQRPRRALDHAVGTGLPVHDEVRRGALAHPVDRLLDHLLSRTGRARRGRRPRSASGPARCRRCAARPRACLPSARQVGQQMVDAQPAAHRRELRPPAGRHGSRPDTGAAARCSGSAHAHCRARS